MWGPTRAPAAASTQRWGGRRARPSWPRRRRQRTEMGAATGMPAVRKAGGQTRAGRRPRARARARFLAPQTHRRAPPVHPAAAAPHPRLKKHLKNQKEDDCQACGRFISIVNVIFFNLGRDRGGHASAARRLVPSSWPPPRPPPPPPRRWARTHAATSAATSPTARPVSTVKTAAAAPAAAARGGHHGRVAGGASGRGGRRRTPTRVPRGGLCTAWPAAPVHSRRGRGRRGGRRQ